MTLQQKEEDIPVIPVQPVTYSTPSGHVPTVTATAYGVPPPSANPAYHQQQEPAYPTTPATVTAQPYSATTSSTAVTPSPTPTPPVQRDNTQAWYIIGGSVVCTAIVLCCCCFILPLVIFIIIFSTAWSQSQEIANSFNDDFYNN
ncbi:expressed unknown protein [Seminavis robusta]|uniref:Uncharacterized protein n=1 Tax=Seminavis robusta TaxID=568900 RepID=A0A9N8DTE3_9STRA|nr:expressed unknown protein [Seminavis robusta]|eukprot:Sro357_g125490.1 n/a (145) ;mRNA; r:3749-4183